ncbi:MAG: DUF4249 domain-containing protein [Candidatus Competibacteraceae bacterium]|nr:DUF4249 domain-containing protein [Candidatus Competibacteraceae bacterium]
MKKIIVYSSLLFVMLIMFQACEQNIIIDLPTPEPMLVVDGYIENDENARITISRSVPYFEQINLTDITTLQNLFVSNASVFVSDGIITDSLVFTIDPNSFPPVYFKSTNPLLVGQPGKTYFLTIYAEGDTLTSYTTIPPLVYLDSIYWKPDPVNNDIGMGWGHLTDPDTLGNIYRLFAKRQGYPYYVSAGTLSDKTFNGTSTSFSFNRPDAYPKYIPNNEPQDTARFYFVRGDTIGVKFCTIDSRSYDFIRSYTIASASFGNPFASPTFVKSNIIGGFGGFVGYGASYYQYIVPQ